ncbi:hypothetical protein C6P42_004502 [Pichia californica]|nr:hypothetical protein C6P42_004502 [[Candida] californica]
MMKHINFSHINYSIELFKQIQLFKKTDEYEQDINYQKNVSTLYNITLEKSICLRSNSSSSNSNSNNSSSTSTSTGPNPSSQKSGNLSGNLKSRQNMVKFISNDDTDATTDHQLRIPQAQLLISMRCSNFDNKQFLDNN